ncbi:F0F1 ATP synthase subunit delta [Nocardioides flavescens]|uniref:ATP synthase subunit delta n=1 Tax=Nocardioides flavescens TaxID=2691959 RepID=A0A6L7F3P7_9ACTN|nr:F0F1 ATP synthase subunit delta [Nocardioides flavescens]MXG91857.1 F0F1 ATP synthase subunit delta [Nocardioides flavescens]
MVHPLSSLRGSSAEALHDLGDRLDSGSLTEEQYATLGSDLFGVAALLRSEPALRRTVTDVSTAAEAKSSLARQLLDGKVSGPAVDLVADAVAKRWVAARDLADTLEHLGAVAVVRSAGREAAGRLSDELFVVGQTVEANPELGTALSDPQRSASDKAGLLRALLASRVLPATMTLAEQALSGSHRSFGAAIGEYQKVAAATYGEGVALVTAARELTDAEQERLARALSAQYDRPIHLNLEVDRSLLGGLRVEIGDDVIDGTVLARLDEARRRLAG